MNVRNPIAVLAAALALTVFAKSLILENLRNAGSTGATNGVSGQNANPPIWTDWLLGRTPVPTHSVTDRFATAIAFYEARNLDGAARLALAALGEHPDDPNVLRLLGAIEFEQSQFASAATHLRQCLELGVTDGLARLQLGIAELREEQYPKALIEFSLLLQEHPQDGPLNFLAACARVELKQNQAAMAHLRTALQDMGAALLPYMADRHLDGLRHMHEFRELVKEAACASARSDSGAG